MKKATIRDVAREAGVSMATASNALNNPEIVKPHTREAVLEAARRLSYVPNANGKRLRAKQSKAMGLFVNSMAGEFYGVLADTMNQVCRAHGYELDICIVSDIQSIWARLQDHSMDGAVIYWDAVDQKSAADMMTTDFPLVFLSLNEHGPHASSILFESRKHGEMAAEYLYGLGKRTFMHIFGLPGNYDSEMRCEGFLEALAAHGVDRNSVCMLEGRFERSVAYREMRKYLLEGNPLPDAIFASNDLSTIGCIAALSEMGYRIPEDVSIMGCDDISLCEYITPGLTTIRTHFQEIGTLAAQEVFRLIQGEPGRLICQDGVLVVRRSCAPSGSPS
ncbi:MAG: LacI family DNA-binding transcriptional regulator [Clostridia bacterium]|nr:LacI family DNA-binding transcriptional regulator [Clostridia bacterium]